MLLLAGLYSSSAAAQYPYPSPYPAPGGYGAPVYPAPYPVYSRSKETPAGFFGGATAGFRAARLDADIDGADDSYSFLASGAGVLVGSVKFLTARLGLDAHVGGGAEDVESRISGHLTFGVIGHWAQQHGAFIRVGVGGNHEGNGRYFLSHFDLPLGEGGFQLHGDRIGLEAGVRGGATLTGRLGIAPSDNLAFGAVGRWGGYATLAVSANGPRYPGGWLDVEFVRLEHDTAIHVGSGRVCGGYLAFLCLDAKVLHADLPFGTAVGSAGTFEDAVVLYAGATLGIGAAVAADGVRTFGF